jgi:hypothetical protein
MDINGSLGTVEDCGKRSASSAAILVAGPRAHAITIKLRDNPVTVE